ncbi:MAG TPA: ketoacyl-ACP synthase III [Kofleriaceae bacterium]
MTTSVRGVRIAGVAAAVPEQIVANEQAGERFGAAEAAKIIKSTGIVRRRVAADGQCASDLCIPAGERLLADLGWDKASVDALIFVSQTGDYLLPATACLVQHRLGLRKSCAAFDLTLGCSGYVYGLWVASGLVAAGLAKRVLLLVGEISTRRVNAADRAAALLFGDAGTATAIEADPDAPALHFELGTDGAGGEHLVVPAGGCRLLPSTRTAELQSTEDGSQRSLGDVAMNGVEVFIFSTREVPAMIRTVMTAAELGTDTVDALVLHQANEFMLKHIAKSLKIPMTKVPLSLHEFGNTSSATLPITLVHALAEPLRTGPQRLVLAGFGVGLSWGAVAGTFGPMVISPLVEVPATAMYPVLTGGLAL